MTNVLKKITIGNPLINFEMFDELDEYESLKTDSEIADFYHKMLNAINGKSSLLESFLWEMINFSTGIDAKSKVNELMNEDESNGSYFSIELKCGRWLVNGKRYNEMNAQEIIFLQEFFKKTKKSNQR